MMEVMVRAIQEIEDAADEKSRVLARMGLKNVPILFEVHEILNILQHTHDEYVKGNSTQK